MSLLDVLTHAQNELDEENGTEGSANIRERLRIAMTDSIKRCSFSRWEIAGKMSHLLGVEVSKYQIDAWTAESKEGHRVPAEYLPAFCIVTGDHGPLRMMAETAGLFALPGPDALRAEIQKLDEETKRLQREKRKRERFLKEMKQ
ncbi:hypothetical protein [Desulfobulbus elongatus]|uniref:hypothetical protein n=1 Tax=Desulfobulbus elongatus TaxID=53332 RepID=UPI0006860668|nr:hypothetical protein [Desulfobulbus elongatus]